MMLHWWLLDGLLLMAEEMGYQHMSSKIVYKNQFNWIQSTMSLNGCVALVGKGLLLLQFLVRGDLVLLKNLVSWLDKEVVASSYCISARLRIASCG
jgi:hypothetical protein